VANDDSRWFGIVAALAAALVIACLALLVSAWHLGPRLITSWMIILFQILLTFSAGALACAFVVIMPTLAVRSIGAANERYPEVAKGVRRRAPTLAAIGTLLSEAAVTIVDEGANTSDAAWSLRILAILFFWIGNEILLKRTAWRRLGIAWWILTVVMLFWATAHTRHQTMAELASAVMHGESIQLFTFALVLVALAVIPWVLAPAQELLEKES
jgi:hypothetical protein